MDLLARAQDHILMLRQYVDPAYDAPALRIAELISVVRSRLLELECIHMDGTWVPSNQGAADRDPTRVYSNLLGRIDAFLAQWPPHDRASGFGPLYSGLGPRKEAYNWPEEFTNGPVFLLKCVRDEILVVDSPGLGLRAPAAGLQQIPIVEAVEADSSEPDATREAGADPGHFRDEPEPIDDDEPCMAPPRENSEPWDVRLDVFLPNDPQAPPQLSLTDAILILNADDEMTMLRRQAFGDLVQFMQSQLQRCRGSSPAGWYEVRARVIGGRIEGLSVKPRDPEPSPSAYATPMSLRLCLVCGSPTAWVRHTQFTGSHPFCAEHAKKQPDFGVADSMKDWVSLSSPEATRKRHG